MSTTTKNRISHKLSNTATSYILTVSPLSKSSLLTGDLSAACLISIAKRSLSCRLMTDSRISWRADLLSTLDIRSSRDLQQLSSGSSSNLTNLRAITRLLSVWEARQEWSSGWDLTRATLGLISANLRSSNWKDWQQNISTRNPWLEWKLTAILLWLKTLMELELTTGSWHIAVDQPRKLWSSSRIGMPPCRSRVSRLSTTPLPTRITAISCSADSMRSST